MDDEKYVFFQDVREKKVTGYSARKQRSHCGKGGRVKFPSDYLTKKELKNMSGECKSYRMNSPMKWQEFKAMPKDLQIAYIKAIKDKYNPPIVAIAKMMEIDRANLSRYLMSLGFEKGERGHRPWDKMGFTEWCFGVPKTEECQSVQEENEEVLSAEVAEEILNILGEDPYPNETEEEPLAVEEVDTREPLVIPVVHLKAIPTSGNMTFDCCAADALKTVTALLRDAHVRLSISWETVED